MPLLAVSLLLLFLVVARAELARLRPALYHARRECHADLLLRRRAANGIAPHPHPSRPPRGFIPRAPIKVYGGGGALALRCQ